MAHRPGQARAGALPLLPANAAGEGHAAHGSKLEASLAIEGKFSDEGLLAMTQGEDMTTALAKALVDGLGGEGVEDIWSKLNDSNRQYRQRAPFADGLLFYVDPATVAERSRRTSRRRPRTEPAQMTLLDGL